MKEPVWVEKEALLLLHAKSLARFGGAEGMRAMGLLDSALVRPRNIFLYDGIRDMAALAAAYAFGLARNHPFADGNKRAAFLAIGLFLDANGWNLNVEPAEAIAAVVALADSKMDEGECAAWLKLHIKRKKS